MSVRSDSGAVSRFLLVPLFLAVLLTFTGIGTGFLGDDIYHLLILKGERTPSTGGNLYSFLSGDPTITKEFIETGPYPWWTLPEAKAEFLRPLSNALHRLDYSLFGMHAVFWHLHAMIWYVGMVLVWALIARRSLSSGVASLAAILFAIDGTHWMPAVWLANRNALIAGLPPLIGLYAHMRWREERWRWGLPLSLAGYAAGMLGGEAWLGIVAYVAAYEMFGRRDGVGNRMLHIAPAAACAIGYAVLYKAYAYGAYGSGGYVNPLSLDYLALAPGRLAAMIGGLLFGLPVDVSVLVPQMRSAFIAGGLVAIVVFTYVLRRCLPKLDERDRGALRWLVPGAVMSLLPVIAAFPMSRLLLGPSLGGSALLAVLLRHWWNNGREERYRGAGIILASIAVIHIIIAPLMWPIQSAIVMVAGAWADRIYMNAPIDDTRVAEQDVFLIAAYDPLTLMYTPLVRRLHGSALPGSWHCLSSSGATHRFSRTGTNAFELEPEKGPMVTGIFADILRSPKFPLRAGDTITLRGARVTVLDLIAARPRKIRVACEKALEDPSLLFLQMKGNALHVFTPPRVGEAVEVTY